MPHKIKQPKGQHKSPKHKKSHTPSVQFKDYRTQNSLLTNLQESISKSPKSVAQRAQIEKTITPIQKKENKTGLSDSLKSGIENLSGIDISDTRVHYNSSKPAQLQAHAYAQGNQIHIAPGQEKHLPHEAWHVVQQKQGRVQPTRQLKGKTPINDNIDLEREADIMGEKSLKLGNKSSNDITPDTKKTLPTYSSLPLQRTVSLDEDDDETEHIRTIEDLYDELEEEEVTIVKSNSKLQLHLIEICKSKTPTSLSEVKDLIASSGNSKKKKKRKKKKKPKIENYNSDSENDDDSINHKKKKKRKKKKKPKTENYNSDSENDDDSINHKKKRKKKKKSKNSVFEQMRSVKNNNLVSLYRVCSEEEAQNTIGTKLAGGKLGNLIEIRASKEDTIEQVANHESIGGGLSKNEQLQKLQNIMASKNDHTNINQSAKDRKVVEYSPKIANFSGIVIKIKVNRDFITKGSALTYENGKVIQIGTPLASAKIYTKK